MKEKTFDYLMMGIGYLGAIVLDIYFYRVLGL